MEDDPVVRDPAGFDDVRSVSGGNQLSARDLAIAARAFLADPVLAGIVRHPSPRLDRRRRQAPLRHQPQPLPRRLRGGHRAQDRGHRRRRQHLRGRRRARRADPDHRGHPQRRQVRRGRGPARRRLPPRRRGRGRPTTCCPPCPPAHPGPGPTTTAPPASSARRARPPPRPPPPRPPSAAGGDDEVAAGPTSAATAAPGGEDWPVTSMWVGGGGGRGPGRGRGGRPGPTSLARGAGSTAARPGPAVVTGAAGRRAHLGRPAPRVRSVDDPPAPALPRVRARRAGRPRPSRPRRPERGGGRPGAPRRRRPTAAAGPAGVPSATSPRGRPDRPGLRRPPPASEPPGPGRPGPGAPGQSWSRGVTVSCRGVEEVQARPQGPPPSVVVEPPALEVGDALAGRAEVGLQAVDEPAVGDDQAGPAAGQAGRQAVEAGPRPDHQGGVGLPPGRGDQPVALGARHPGRVVGQQPGVALVDLGPTQPGEGPGVALAEVRVDGDGPGAGQQLGRAPGPLQVRRHDPVRQRGGGRGGGGLLPAPVGEGRVGLALPAAVGVPRRLAVADHEDARRTGHGGTT